MITGQPSVVNAGEAIDAELRSSSDCATDELIGQHGGRSSQVETNIIDQRGDTALMGETKMAAKKKTGLIGEVRKAVAKNIASLKANYEREAAALKKQLAAAKKKAAAEVARLKREAVAEIAKVKKAVGGKKKATKKKTAREKR